jgi:hypothetical protein
MGSYVARNAESARRCDDPEATEGREAKGGVFFRNRISKANSKVNPVGDGHGTAKENVLVTEHAAAHAIAGYFSSDNITWAFFLRQCEYAN